MEIIGFIGSLDKKDLLLNVSKVLTMLGKQVLIVDATYLQRMRYIIPKPERNNTMSYVSDYQGTDVAVGFMNLGGIAQYFGELQLKYDFVFIDTDNVQTMYSFELPNIKKLFFATSYDQFEINRAQEIFYGLNRPIKMTRIIFSPNITKTEDEYLLRALSNQFAVFDENKVIIPDTDFDRIATLENQLTRTLNLKHYSGAYKEGVGYIAAIAAEGVINQQEIKKIIRKI